MKFTKKAFKAWLESKTDRTPVGRPENTGQCPLCEFLKSQGAGRVWMHFNFRSVDGKHNIPNPLWAQKFQRAACDLVKGDGFRKITAKKALSFL